MLRYFVGAGTGTLTPAISQLSPVENKIFVANETIDFAWMDFESAMLYRTSLRILKASLSALLPPGAGTYRAPSWLRERVVGGILRWRVIALNAIGQQIAESTYRTLRLSAETTAEKSKP